MLLFAASATALFIELLAIVWLSAEIPILAYLKNFPLLAGFTGLGLGCLLAGARASWFPVSCWALAGLAWVAAGAEPLGLDRIVFPDARLDIWTRGFDPAAVTAAVTTVVNLGKIFGLLAACAVSLMGLGQVIGRRLADGPPLRRYGADLAGSLAGVVAFTALTANRTGPPVWLGLAAVALWVVGRAAGSPRLRLAPPLVLVLAAAAFAQHRLAGGQVTWSPYYRVQLEVMYTPPGDGSRWLRLMVNRDYHQTMIGFSGADAFRYPEGQIVGNRWRIWKFQYDLPYRLRPQAGRVLIGGAGSGNDVAAALRAGAQEVTAVEIDPVILELGARWHPERPWADPRVRTVNTDLRSFWRRADGTWDLIVYGIIDSHTALSALSSLRLDNYVYTVEGIRAAAGHLAPGGVMCITFHESHRRWLGQRLFRTITLAMGAPPVSARVDEAALFVFSPTVGRATLESRVRMWGIDIQDDFYASGSVTPSTDDRPFLYTSPDGQPRVYVFALVMLVLLAAAGTWAALKAGGGSARPVPDARMFLLGAGFLLVETKALAELSLLFGSTWIVNALVMAGIFVMAGLSVLATAAGWAKSATPAYLLLLGSLGAWYLVPRDALNALAFAPRAAVGTGLVVMPLFFAGLVFSRAWSRTADRPRAFGSNLVGAVLGGALESASLAWGIRSLTIIAMTLYAASWAARPSDKDR